MLAEIPSPTAAAAAAWYHIFAGLIFIYILEIRRNQRFATIVTHFSENWRMLIFDMVVFVALGILFVSYMIEPKGVREAFMAGATWEAAALALFTKAPSKPKK